MLNKILVANLHRIPHDIDVVVGVPRSGLLLANMIACYLNKPLTDVDGALAGRLFEIGSTKPRDGMIKNFSTAKKILVVDDTVYTGLSLNRVKARLAHVAAEKIYLAAFVVPESAAMVDMFFATVPQPRVFEWNFMHHPIIGRCCVDFDGVLCQDPAPEQDDDGENYRRFLLTAAPKFIPSFTVGCIVTSRLKKYSEETVRWLNEHNVKFNALAMLDGVTAHQRQVLALNAKFKAQVYGSIESAMLFVESNPDQAQEIFRLTGKPVWCVANSAMYAEV